MDRTQRSHVAVIGAGPAGLSMTKSLIEEGFRVTALEKRDGPGGIWHYTDDPTITSVTSHTRSQLSRFLTPFTDFPHAPGISRHPTGKELGDYYKQYADHFGVSEHIEYGVTVRSVARDERLSKWLITIQGEETPRSFDKVVLATGSEHVRRWPEIENIVAFEGTYIHGQEYKRPEKYAGQNVVVIGQGNSAGDCAVEISSQASRVHIAHNRGALILSRMADGARFDRVASWKFTRLGFWLERWMPFLHRWVFHQAFSNASKSAWGPLDPAWGFDSQYLYATNISTLVFSEALIPALKDKRIISVPPIVRVVGPRKLKIADGSVLEDVDTIIACTGYGPSLDVLGDAIEYVQPAPDVEELPRLYYNIFPPEHADSLACLGYLAFMDNAVICRELAGMAITQMWAGKASLPTRTEMERQIQGHFAWYTNRCRTNAPLKQLSGLHEPDSWHRFIHEKAGTGVYENLGWTLAGLKFSLLHPLEYFKLAYGVGTPHLYRLFDTGKRKVWLGAHAAIDKANEDSAKDIKDSMREWKGIKSKSV